MDRSSWFPDDSTLVAVSNLLLLVLLVVLSTSRTFWRRRARRASRKLVVASRRSRALQYALNVTVNQYHSLRRRFGKGPRAHAVALTPPLVQIPAPPRMVCPPPLDLACPEGDDRSSWKDSGLRTMVAEPSVPLSPDDTRTRPLPLDSELLRQSRPPSPLPWIPKKKGDGV